MCNEKEIVKIVINELVERNLIHKTENSYKNTENLLNNLHLLKKSVQDMKKQIKDLKEYGAPKSTNAVHVVVPNVIREDENEIIDRRISNLRQSIHRTNSVINMINSILNDIRSDKYFMIIELKYFDKKTYEEIAEIMQCDISTVSRNKNRLINVIKVRLFPNTFIDELGY